MEAIVFQALSGEHFRRGRGARATEGAAGAKAGVVDQDEQNVRRTLRRAQLLDRRKLCVRIPGVVGDQARSGRVWHREVRTMFLVFAAHNLRSDGFRI